jgi:hypothetical protein
MNINKTRMTIVAIIASVGLGSAVAPAISQAQPIGTGVAAGCTYKGASSSDGAVVLQDDGIYYKCVNGSWVYDHKQVLAILPPPKTITPVLSATTTAKAVALIK